MTKKSRFSAAGAAPPAMLIMVTITRFPAAVNGERGGALRRGGRCDTINKKGGLDMDYQKSFKILKNGVLWGAFIYMPGLGAGRL